MVSGCDKASCVSNNFIDLITETEKSKFEIITNGYDTETDISVKNSTSSKFFKILYIGGLTWNRYYKSFFIGLKESIETGDLDAGKVRIQLAGSIEPSIKNEIEEIFSKLNVLEIQGYLPHAEAVQLMNEAQLLLLFMEQVKGYEGHIPGKLFEYISTQNRILGLGIAIGESAQILENTNTGKIFEPQNVSEIKDQLVKEYRNWQNGEILQIDTKLIEQYSRKRLSMKLATLFDEVH